MGTYAKNAIYHPTTNKQPEGGGMAQSLLSQNHTSEYLKYGPPPRNFYALRMRSSKRGQCVLYADHSIDDTVTTFKGGGKFDHPLSPNGLKLNPNVFDEFTDTRPDYPGFFHPPIEYAPGQISWQHHKTWQAALATAMLAKGVKVKGDDGEEMPISVQNIQIFYEQLAEQSFFKAETSHVLHHPADRGTAIFKDEPSASTIARWATTPFSLVIVCPVLQADGVGWNRIWDTHNRPPIRARWSTGNQGLHPPLVLGCLPKESFPTDRNWLKKDVHWFTMDPVPKTKFYDFWNTSLNFSNELPQIISKMGLQGLAQDKFLWCIVLLHRRIALGLKVPDEHLGPWIWQFVLHLKSIGSPWKPRPFKFDPEKLKGYGGMPITYRHLTAWITNWRFTGGIRPYAQLWDDAIAALIDYNHNKTDKKWEEFRNKMHKAKTPFW